MCNDYEQHVAWAEYGKMMQALELGMPTGQSELDLPQADDIKVNDICAPFMAIAGIWREGDIESPPAFAMLTTEPGEDVRPYHLRQVVVLRPEDWASWIFLTKPEAEMLRPLPKGSLIVETVRQGSD
ncbi:MAG: hypothetical protein K0S56_91 [Microvirga sp.]|jgi:putative SOS response-associated peptidase YedK|nr:hypothetical protein [Microvirga sp.]